MIILSILAIIGAAIWSAFVVYANGMRSSPGDFRGMGSIIAVWLIAAILLVAAISDKAWSADLELPREITKGYKDSPVLGAFGIYSIPYLQRRWARLCKGGGRYQAMSEAYERGRPNPCH